MSSFALRVDLSGLQDRLQAVNVGCEAAARPAAQAAAQVLYDQVRRNVASNTRRRTGDLAAAIYQAYSPESSSDALAVYHVSWNSRRAPHGHLVEFGHLQRYEVSFDPRTKRFTTHKDRPLPQPKQVAARPFVRPAVAQFPAAMQAAEARYLAELKAHGVVS